MNIIKKLSQHKTKYFGFLYHANAVVTVANLILYAITLSPVFVALSAVSAVSAWAAKLQLDLIKKNACSTTTALSDQHR
jgi:hypothetical protein